MDVNGTYDFTHVSGENTASIFANFQLPIFDRNQGEIARTRYALTQAQEQQQSASDTVLSDVANAFEAVRSNDEVVQLYTSGYLKQAQDSRDISEYAYKRGAASLLGLSRCRAQLPLDPISLSPGTGLLYDCSGAAERSGGNEEPAMTLHTHHATPGSAALSDWSPCALSLGCSGSNPAPRLRQCQHFRQSRTLYDPAGPDVACAGVDGSAHNSDPVAAADRRGGL